MRLHETLCQKQKTRLVRWIKWIKVIAAEPDELSSIRREPNGGKREPTVISCPELSTWHYAHRPMHAKKICF